MKSSRVVLGNKLGLHARAAAKLVQLASQHVCDIRLYANGKQANAKSIMEIMMLAAAKGNELEIRSSGHDEEQADTRLLQLVQERFGEEE